MINIQKKLKKNRKFITFTGFMIILGFLFGFLILKKSLNQSLISELKSISSYLESHHLNFLFNHFITLSILITSSLTIIGLISFPIYFLFTGISLNYNIVTFSKIFGLNGFIFSILYLIVTKLLYLALICLVFRKIVNIVIILKKIFLNKEQNISYGIKKNFQILCFSLFLIFLNDLFIYFCGSKILFKLTFIIK